MIGASIVIWLWPVTRTLFLSHVDAFMLLLGSPALVSMVVVYAAIFMGGVTWILHNQFLILETAAIGAALITVAGGVDRFLIALFDQQFTIVTEMIRSSALLFVVIFLAGVGIQSGTVYQFHPDS